MGMRLLLDLGGHDVIEVGCCYGDYCEGGDDDYVSIDEWRSNDYCCVLAGDDDDDDGLDL